MRPDHSGRLLAAILALALALVSLLSPLPNPQPRRAFAGPPSTGPGDVALNTSTNRAYLTRYGSSALAVFDTVSQQKVGEVRDVGVVVYAQGSPAPSISRPAVDASANRIYVVNAARVSGAASATQLVTEWRAYVVDGARDSVVDSFPVPGGVDLAFDPGYRRLYVATGEETVAVYDPQSKNKLTTIPVGGRLAVNGAARRLYVGNKDRLYAVNTETNSVVASVALPPPAAPAGYELDLNRAPEVRDIAVDDRTGRVYAATSFQYQDGRGQSLVLGNVAVVDSGGNQVVAIVSDSRAARPRALAVDPERGKLYIVPDVQVGGQWNVLTVARTSDHAVTGTRWLAGGAAAPDGGSRLRSLVADPARHRLYVATQPLDQQPYEILLLTTASDAWLGGLPGTPQPEPTSQPSPTSTPQSSPTAQPTSTATAQPTSTATPQLTSTPTPASSSLDARVEIVWPHDSAGKQASVTAASLVNITAYLFQPGTLSPPRCDIDAPVRLWRALNTQPAEMVATGQRRLASAGGRSFPVWDFNDVAVPASRDAVNKYYFFLSADGSATTTSIWSHGADARTYFPQQDTPTGTAAIGEADARIQIVWPHDAAGAEKPVRQASLVNVEVDIYQRGTMTSAPPDWSPPVWLYRSLNNGPAEQVAQGQKSTAAKNGVTYPRWVFNDVPVGAAQDPLNKYYFRVQIDGVTATSNIWSHGADARTYFPNPDRPSADCGS